MLLPAQILRSANPDSGRHETGHYVPGKMPREDEEGSQPVSLKTEMFYIRFD